MDETEYLHASWLMANGERLYETFFEHHSPFLFKIFEPLAPAEIEDVRPYVTRSRWLAGAFGLISLASLGTLLWRLSPAAAPIAVALLIATGPMWLRGFADIRAEVCALAFFCAGAAVSLLTRRWYGGVGVGFVAISCLWTPKWPIACLVIGVFWLILCRERVRGVVAGVITLAAAFGALRSIVSFDAWWFFNVEVNAVLTRLVGTSQKALDTYFQGGVPFLFVPDAFAPWIIGPAAFIAIAAFVIDRRALRLIPVMLLLASLIEMRFLYPWPAIWAHYYLMWSVAAATVIGILPSSIAVLLARTRLRPAIALAFNRLLTGTILFLALAHVLAVAPERGDSSPYWVSESWLRERLEPGDVVWIEPTRHPIAVRDAHYYWFSVGQMADGAAVLRQTPRGRRFLPPPERFPTCVLPPNLRFTLDPRRAGLTEAGACFDRLLASGRARKTTIFDVYEIRLLESEADPVALKGTE